MIFHIIDEDNNVFQDSNIDRLRNFVCRSYLSHIDSENREEIERMQEYRTAIFNEKGLIAEEISIYANWGVGVFVLRTVHKSSGLTKSYRSYHPLDEKFYRKKIEWLELKSLENKQLLYYYPMIMYPIYKVDPFFKNLEELT